MIIKGDVNGDGKITVEDLMLVRAHLLEQITLTDNAYIAADTNNDGLISTSDMANIRFHLLGLMVINEVIE